MIQPFGRPGVSVVGEEGSEAARRIVQHAFLELLTEKGHAITGRGGQNSPGKGNHL